MIDRHARPKRVRPLVGLPVRQCVGQFADGWVRPCGEFTGYAENDWSRRHGKAESWGWVEAATLQGAVDEFRAGRVAWVHPLAEVTA